MCMLKKTSIAKYLRITSSFTSLSPSQHTINSLPSLHHHSPSTPHLSLLPPSHSHLSLTTASPSLPPLSHSHLSLTTASPSPPPLSHSHLSLTPTSLSLTTISLTPTSPSPPPVPHPHLSLTITSPSPPPLPHSHLSLLTWCLDCPVYGLYHQGQGNPPLYQQGRGVSPPVALHHSPCRPVRPVNPVLKDRHPIRVLYLSRPHKHHPPPRPVQARGFDHVEEGVSPVDGLGGVVYCQGVGPAEVLGVEDRPIGAVHGGAADLGGGAPVRPEEETVCVCVGGG